jgi:predicted metal-binding membrane protein
MMSLGWMLALTIVISAERTTRNGIWVTRVAAVALVALAVIAPLHPEVAAGLHMPPAPMGM